MSREAVQHLYVLVVNEGGEAPVVVNAGDREGDIYERLLEAANHREGGAALLARGLHNSEIKPEPEEQDEDGEVARVSRGPGIGALSP
jgi:hypothetical protein